MSFELINKQCLLKSYSGARGKSEDAKPRAVFVLEAEQVSAKIVCALFGLHDPAELTDIFFQPLKEGSKNRDKRIPAMPYVPTSYYSEGHHSIAFGTRRPDRISWLGAVKCVPLMDGKFDISFKATVDEPAAGLCDYLNKNINKSVAVELTCDPGFAFQFKGSSQAPVEKKDKNQGDLKLGEPTAKDTAAIGAVADTLAQQDAKDAKKSAGAKTVKPAATKKASTKPKAKKAAKKR